MSEPTPTVKVEVQVSHLRIGGHEFHPDEVTYRRRDKLTLPENYAVRLGTSVRIISAPVPEPDPAEPESDPGEETSEEAPAEEPEPLPDPAVLVDLSLMNIKEVIELIETTDKISILEAFLEAETAGKNRKTVIEALKTKLTA